MPEEIGGENQERTIRKVIEFKEILAIKTRKVEER